MLIFSSSVISARNIITLCVTSMDKKHLQEIVNVLCYVYYPNIYIKECIKLQRKGINKI